MGRVYSVAFKERMVRRLVGPGAWSANALAGEVGVPQTVLSRWVREASNVGGMKKPPHDRPTPSTRKQWTAREKLRVVIEAAALSEEALGEFLRREGLHEADLQRWRETAVTALGGAARDSKVRAHERAQEARRVQALERELRRKEKALAEAAALLVLKKKVQEIWGDEADATDGRSEP
jgi:transposase